MSMSHQHIQHHQNAPPSPGAQLCVLLSQQSAFLGLPRHVYPKHTPTAEGRQRRTRDQRASRRLSPHACRTIVGGNLTRGPTANAPPTVANQQPQPIQHQFVQPSERTSEFSWKHSLAASPHWTSDKPTAADTDSVKSLAARRMSQLQHSSTEPVPLRGMRRVRAGMRP